LAAAESSRRSLKLSIFALSLPSADI